jgi:hypothetical protein
MQVFVFLSRMLKVRLLKVAEKFLANRASWAKMQARVRRISAFAGSSTSSTVVAQDSGEKNSLTGPVRWLCGYVEELELVANDLYCNSKINK